MPEPTLHGCWQGRGTSTWGGWPGTGLSNQDLSRLLLRLKWNETMCAQQLSENSPLMVAITTYQSLSLPGPHRRPLLLPRLFFLA